MKGMQSFLVFYYILSKCYFAWYEKLEESQIESWRNLASACCPETWGGGRPRGGDDTEWKEQTDFSSLTKENMVDAVIRFLEYQEREYMDDMAAAKKVIREMADEEMVEEALAYAQRMYDEYQYDD